MAMDDIEKTPLWLTILRGVWAVLRLLVTGLTGGRTFIVAAG